MEDTIKGKISVIMGIYNCANTLDESIECILNQTYTDWEMIMCDDGSSDNTYEVAQKYVKQYPDKFVLLKNDENIGLNATLNRCLEEAKGEYIARMDGDDTCSPERFEKEAAILEENPDIAIVGTNMSLFDESGIWGSTKYEQFPTKKSFLRASPFCHASCLVRKEAYLAVEGYSVDEKWLRVEDYHLWIKMYAKGYKGFNIQECLYQMRDDQNATKRRTWKNRFNEARVRRYAVKQLKLGFHNYILSLRPILLGVVPKWLYKKLHHRRLREEK